MKTSITFLASLALVALFAAHCQPSVVAEGDRCNPGLSHNECANDPVVQCVVPTNCAVAYCCSPNSTSPNCQACAAGDGGIDGGDDGGADAGVDSAAEAATDSAVDEATDAAPADAAEAG